MTLYLAARSGWTAVARLLVLAGASADVARALAPRVRPRIVGFGASSLVLNHAIPVPLASPARTLMRVRAPERWMQSRRCHTPPALLSTFELVTGQLQKRLQNLQVSNSLQVEKAVD